MFGQTKYFAYLCSIKVEQIKREGYDTERNNLFALYASA